nr:translation initiation factor IF-2 N-terminal domain-containing protein [Corynebacterium aquilae]
MQKAAAEYDRDVLGQKIRVHALAKQLKASSKDLIAALDGLGLVKVAQSTLSREEALRLIDSLATPKPTTANPDEEKIRARVEKNVANEIKQIEEKVERDLAETAGGSEEFAHAVVAEQDAEPLEDVVPEIAPAPAPAPAPAATMITPIFQPPTTAPLFVPPTTADDADDADDDTRRTRRRGRRGASRGKGDKDTKAAEATTEATTTDVEEIDEPKAIKGSTRLEAQRRRRHDRREEGRKKRVLSEEEFLARRESVHRTMVVRDRRRTDHPGLVTQVGVLEDGLLVEHFVTSETQSTLVGNIYLGRVQNVLPSMEAAFIDIGKGRNGVLYAGEVDWRSTGLGGRSRRIEQALKAGDYVLVQVSKDPVGHKGARLTTQISLAGRFLVYVPGGKNAGISRKLPDTERKRLKEILRTVVPKSGGAIIRTAAEGVSEKDIEADVLRLHGLWEDIKVRVAELKKDKTSGPVALYEEPDMLVKVVRDLFNEDFEELVVEGRRAWNTVSAYVKSVAPDLYDRLTKFEPKDHDGQDVFAHYRLDEQLHKALSRKVWLPSGGTLVIDRTEAMTVIDVNTGKFTGSGGNLEETVTRNNLEAAEEIVRQMRLRDMGGMIVVDFIDMVLPENQELVLRRLTEALGRDRTRHQVSEVTSLGLVQMTRKRLGTGLIETFATECEECEGRGLIIHDDPVEHHDPERHVKKRGGHHDRKDHDRDEHRDRDHDRDSRDSRDRGREDTKDRDNDRGRSKRTTRRPIDEDLESLVAAIVPDDDAESDREQTSEEDSRGGRNRRRGRRRDEERGNRKQSARSHEHDDHDDDDASDIAAIAAAAVAVADNEDPDEPSGADYLPEHTTSRTRRRSGASRRGKNTRDRAEKDSDRQVRELANADSDVDVVVSATAAATPQQDVAAAGLEFSTYEEALAAYEASPRRKRATRGNSRSDVPPRPEDYPENASGDNAAALRDSQQRLDAAAHDAQDAQVARGAAQKARAQAAEAAEDADTVAPVSRTRRRKAGAGETTRRRRVKVEQVALGDDGIEEEIIDDTTAIPADNPADTDNNTGETPSQRRTRRRKAAAASAATRRRAVKVLEVPADLSELAADTAEEPEAATEESAPATPQRTRRRKAAAGTAKKAAPAAQDADEAPAKPRRRAAAKKAAPQETTNDGGDTAADSGAASRRRRRATTSADSQDADGGAKTPAKKPRKRASAPADEPAAEEKKESGATTRRRRRVAADKAEGTPVEKDSAQRGSTRRRSSKNADKQEESAGSTTRTRRRGSRTTRGN